MQPLGKIPVKLVDKFWRMLKSKINVVVRRPALGPCWEWQGCRSGKKNKGYGRSPVRDIQQYLSSELVHRQVYMIRHKVLLTKNEPVCHYCDNPPCFRPTHLWQGSQQQNNLDMYKKGRVRGGVGSANRHAKLSEQQVQQIRKLYVSGITQVVLASKFGVSQFAISSVVNRKTWKG